MKYQLEYCPNPDCLKIHVDKRLTDKMIESWDTEEGGLCSFDDRPTPAHILEMFAVDGVDKVSVNRYNFQISKGTVFEWDALVPQLLAIIKKYYEPEGEMVEAKPPKRMTIDREGRVQDMAFAESLLRDDFDPDSGI